MPPASDHFQAFVRLRTKQGDWVVHPDLRERLVKDAAADGTNLTEVAVQILARSCGVPFEPNGRRTAPSKGADELNLRLPLRLYHVLTATYGSKYQDGIRSLLCAHYGLRVPARPRRTRRRAAAA
jgi:hypothetical protein